MADHSTSSVLSFGRIPHEDPDNRIKLESAIGDWMFQLERTKWTRALQYFENAAYLSGNHLTRFFYTAESGFGSMTFGVHDSSQFDQLVAKVADNRLIRPVETVVSMLTETKPEGRVEPNSDTPEDEDAADLAEIVLELLWEKPLGLPAKIREAAMVACICGTATIEIEYGETDFPIEIPRMKIRKRVNPMKDQEGEEPTIEYLVEDGTEVEMRRDAMARVWTPFHITVDPAATSATDLTWIARSTYEDIDWIRDNFDRDEEGYFPESLDAVVQDPTSRNVLYWYAKFQDIIDSPQYSAQGGGLAPQSFATAGGYAPNQAIFTVIDVKPSRQYPRGRTLITAGGKLIYAGKARAWSEDYAWRWHPYAFFNWFKLPGRFWGTPLLSELVPLQKKINAIDALVAANRRFMAIGQWLIGNHSKIPEGYITGIPAQQIYYTDVPSLNPPQRVPHVPLPAELLVERGDLLQSIDHIAASGAVDANVSRSAARSGALLDFLRKEKLRSKTAMLQDWEQFLETIAQNVLIEVQTSMRDEDPDLLRRIQIATREHSSLAIKAFTGASLRDHHAVKIDVASRLLKSPEAEQAKALEFLQYSAGNITAAERQAVQKAIGLDRFVKNEESASVSRARRMISRVISGQMEAAGMFPDIETAGVMLPVFKIEVLSDRFHDHPLEVKEALLKMVDAYAEVAAQEAQQAFQLEVLRAQRLGTAPQPGAGQQPAQETANQEV